MTYPMPDPKLHPSGPHGPREFSAGAALYTGQPHGWARDKSCGCGVGEDEVCDCAAVIAEYAALMKSLMEPTPPVYVRQVGGRWEVQR